MSLMPNTGAPTRYRQARAGADLPPERRAPERWRGLHDAMPYALLHAGVAAGGTERPAGRPHAPTRPRVLAEAGLGDRFRYWYGHSGRRYLFSAVDPADLADLRHAVVLVVGRDTDRLDYVGLAVPDAAPADRIYVHLLADSDAARDDVVADLAPHVV